MRPGVAIALCFCWLVEPGRAADWQPVKGPLATRWASQVTPDKVHPEYPRPQLVRKNWQNLNGLWDYAITARDAARPEQWDGKILVPFCIESSLGGVGKHVTKDQLLWYRRTIETPATWKGQRVLLNFDAVDWETTVYVNGKELGTHKGGFDPFTFDITSALKDGKGEVVLRVWDPTDQGAQPRGKQVSRPGGIWYTPVTGIWQTVWMEPVPDSATGTPYIKSLWFTPDIDKGEVEVLVTTDAPSDRVAAEVKVGDGVASGIVKPGQPTRVKIPKPHLWSPDDPHLYSVTVQLSRENPTTKAREQGEMVSSYFAMRKVSVGKDDKGLLRILLNNQPLFQIGPLDQGWWPDGLLTPPSDAALRYDLEVLKQLGMNMLRKHIKVEPSRLYYHCDQLGLLVWQDMPSGGMPPRKQLIAPNARDDATFTEDEKRQFRTELKAMLDHLRFFPCIVVWVPFNEGWGQHDTNEILKWVKEYDPTRLVDGPSGWADRGYGDLKDMHNYPGPGMFPAQPDRVSVLGEFGGLGLPVKNHLWKDSGNWGYRTLRTTEDLRTGYRQLIHRLHPLIGRGLSAAVYTQTTDVEVEVNGLLTYDRAMLKLDPKETAAWHKALFGPAPEYQELVPTSETTAQQWKFTTNKPAADWEAVAFDDSSWSAGAGGFGTKGTPGAVIGSVWNSADIWLRRSFELKALPIGEVLLRIHHDEDTEVFVNGVLAARTSGYTTDYVEVPLTPAGRAALKAGKNVVAVHCHQTGGGQYIDIGFVEVKVAR